MASTFVNYDEDSDLAKGRLCLLFENLLLREAVLVVVVSLTAQSCRCVAMCLLCEYVCETRRTHCIMFKQTAAASTAAECCCCRGEYQETQAAECTESLHISTKEQRADV